MSSHSEHWEFQHVSENALNVKAGDDEMRNGRSCFFFKPFYSPTCYVKIKGLLIGRAEHAVSNKIPSENPLKSP